MNVCMNASIYANMSNDIHTDLFTHQTYEKVFMLNILINIISTLTYLSLCCGGCSYLGQGNATAQNQLSSECVIYPLPQQIDCVAATHKQLCKKYGNILIYNRSHSNVLLQNFNITSAFSQLVFMENCIIILLT